MAHRSRVEGRLSGVDPGDRVAERPATTDSGPGSPPTMIDPSAAYDVNVAHPAFPTRLPTYRQPGEYRRWTDFETLLLRDLTLGAAPVRCWLAASCSGSIPARCGLEEGRQRVRARGLRAGTAQLSSRP